MIDQNIIRMIKEKAAQYAPLQLDTLKQFASFDSETNDVEGNEKVTAICREQLSALGAEIIDIPYEHVGTHLVARIRAEHAKGRIVLNAHLDTVFPKGYAGRYPWHIEGDWLYGLGVLDCKGGFAVSCTAVRIARELGILPDLDIDLVYVCDEEQGSVTGQEVYKDICQGADAAFIFEPGIIDDAGSHLIVTSRQGVILGNLDITGVEAHAGAAYSRGHSANKELAHKILELYSFNDEEKGVYYNAAPVSGGRPNGVVSGNANMQFCVAGIPDEKTWQKVEHNLERLGSHTYDPGCSLNLTWRKLFPPQLHMKESTSIFRTIQNAAGLLGMKVREDGVNMHGEDIHCAGDANYLGDLGIPAIDGFGPIGCDMHAVTERLYIPSIQEKTELFAAFLYYVREHGLYTDI